MAYGRDNPLSDEFASLILEAEAINKAIQPDARFTASIGGDILKKIRTWIDDARAFAAKEGVDSVTIGAGWPAGVSISVTFRVSK